MNKEKEVLDPKFEQEAKDIGLDLNKGGEIKEAKEMKGTPFYAVRYYEEWYIMWGNYIISKPQKTEAECKKFLKTNLWDVIAVYALSVINQAEKESKKR